MSSPGPLIAVPSDERGVMPPAVAPAPTPNILDEPFDFSLIQGGPFFQLLLRTGLLRPPTDLLARRIVALLIITWVPVLLLSAMAGQAFGGVEVPFFHDIG